MIKLLLLLALISCSQAPITSDAEDEERRNNVIERITSRR